MSIVRAVPVGWSLGSTSRMNDAGEWVYFIGRCPRCKTSEEYISGLGSHVATGVDRVLCQDCRAEVEVMWGTP